MKGQYENHTSKKQLFDVLYNCGRTLTYAVQDVQPLWIMHITWWSLFQKRVVHTKFEIYVFINKLKNSQFFYADNYILYKFPMAPLRDVSI
jgi:hypothetical protein